MNERASLPLAAAVSARRTRLVYEFAMHHRLREGLFLLLSHVVGGTRGTQLADALQVERLSPLEMEFTLRTGRTVYEVAERLAYAAAREAARRD